MRLEIHQLDLLASLRIASRVVKAINCSPLLTTTYSSLLGEPESSNRQRIISLRDNGKNKSKSVADEN